MKKLLILLMASLLVFSACKKEQEQAADILTDDTAVEAPADPDAGVYEEGDADMDDIDRDDETEGDHDGDEMMDKDEDGEMDDASEDTEGEDSTMDDKEGEEMMDDESDDTATPTVGTYAPYTEDAIANASGKVVLAFFAEWCPACNAADKDLNANGDQLPGDVTVLEVNYDDATALKEKYNVTGQHTFVQIDSA